MKVICTEPEHLIIVPEDEADAAFLREMGGMIRAEIKAEWGDVLDRKLYEKHVQDSRLHWAIKDQNTISTPFIKLCKRGGVYDQI